jgi:hypothetical protein
LQFFTINVVFYKRQKEKHRGVKSGERSIR